MLGQRNWVDRGSGLSFLISAGMLLDLSTPGIHSCHSWSDNHLGTALLFILLRQREWALSFIVFVFISTLVSAEDALLKICNENVVVSFYQRELDLRFSTFSTRLFTYGKRVSMIKILMGDMRRIVWLGITPMRSENEFVHADSL